VDARDQRNRDPRHLLHALVAALAGAVVTLTAVLMLRPVVPQPVVPPEHDAQSQIDAGESDAATLADTTTADVTPAEVLPTPVSPTAAPLPHPLADPGLKIVADPTELRVWANTAVRMRVESTGEVSFDRYVWHFEDGSEPVSGLEVEHTFAESVRDRHVTVEALRAGQPPVVVSRRLPVERLEIAPVDGGPAQEQAVALPSPQGTRLLLAGGPLGPDVVAAIAAMARKAHADLVIVTDAAAAQALVAQVAEVPVLVAPLEPGVPEPMQIASNPEDRLAPLRKGTRDLGVLTLGELALVAIDTRADTVGEPQLKQVRDGLLGATAYPATVLWTARPLTLVRDGELIADRAYRIYEHALRQQVTVVVSGSSGVVYDGRFGGQQVVAIGRAQAGECMRLTGTDACQPPTLTVLDVAARGKVAVHVLTGPGFDRLLTRQELPSEAGKIRR
jgi:hypothetical protein